MAVKKQETTRNDEFNYYKHNGMIDSVKSVTAVNNYQNITLLEAGTSIQTTGAAIIDDAKNNRTMKDLGYDVVITEADVKLIRGNTYYIFGAPHKEILSNRQHYSNCGVESVLNTLASAGIIKIGAKQKEQLQAETDFLTDIWNRGLAIDAGEVGILDDPDGGTFEDDYKEMLKLYNIDSESYFLVGNVDGKQYSNLNELAYKISQGYGAMVSVCSKILWKEEDQTNLSLDHTIAITGVVYDTKTPDANTVPKGFYIHDSGAWMTRYISLEDFKNVTLYSKQGVNPLDPDTYLQSLRVYDAKTQTFVGKESGGIFGNITSEAIKENVLNIDATGTAKDNQIFGNSGKNTIKGLGGNDLLVGNAGNDSIYGGAGNDIIFGNSVLEDDVEKFKDLVEDESVKARLDGIETTTESKRGLDSLYGDAGNDIIFGSDDNDLIYGDAGNDYIYTGDGRDAAYGGKGDDVIFGGYDKDRLFGDAGNDIIYGFEDDDTIHAGDGNDLVYGGSGNDRIELGKGNDIIYFEGKNHGFDMISSTAGSNQFIFTDDEFSDGYVIDDMFFSLEKQGNTNMYEFKIKYDESEAIAKNSVEFYNFYNKTNNKQQNLTIIDANDETYAVKATVQAKASVADVSTSTKGGHDKINNILFTTCIGSMNVTTSVKNDFVYMMDSGDIFVYTDVERTDIITYTGGKDTYYSFAGDTDYYVNAFNGDMNLAICDRAVEKVVLDEETGIPLFDENNEPITQMIKSTDSLYLNSEISNVRFLFDVAMDDFYETYKVTENNYFYFLNDATVTYDTYKDIASDIEIDGGYIFVDKFFTQGESFQSEDLYDEGRIEKLYTKNTPVTYVEYNLDNAIAEISSNVATWLSTSEYDSAFEAFSSNTISEEDFAALVTCYCVT